MMRPNVQSKHCWLKFYDQFLAVKTISNCLKIIILGSKDVPKIYLVYNPKITNSQLINITINAYFKYFSGQLLFERSVRAAWRRKKGKLKLLRSRGVT